MVFLIGEYLAIKGRLRRTNKEKKLGEKLNPLEQGC